MQPFIAVGVVEVPMCVDQMPDRVGTSLCHVLPDTAMPASTSTLPSGPVSTATLPPDPSSTLTLLRSECTLISAVAAASRIMSTIPRALAKTWRGESHPPAANAAVQRQQKQKPRRDSVDLCMADEFNRASGKRPAPQATTKVSRQTSDQEGCWARRYTRHRAAARCAQSETLRPLW